jgi:hypothetical protein
MAGIPGISGFSAPGPGGIPSGIIPPVGSFKLPAGLPLGAGASPTPSGAVRGVSPRPKPYGPFDVTSPLIQAYGVQSRFNPMMVFDLMNMGLAPFQSPFSGSGLPGFPTVVSGSRVMSAPAGPTLSGQLASAAPVPQSGGKGILG